MFLSSSSINALSWTVNVSLEGNSFDNACEPAFADLPGVCPQNGGDGNGASDDGHLALACQPRRLLQCASSRFKGQHSSWSGWQRRAGYGWQHRRPAPPASWCTCLLPMRQHSVTWVPLPCHSNMLQPAPCMPAWIPLCRVASATRLALQGRVALHPREGHRLVSGLP